MDAAQSAALPSSCSMRLCLETTSVATRKALVSGYQDCLVLHAEATADGHSPLSRQRLTATKAVLVHYLKATVRHRHDHYLPTFVKAANAGSPQSRCRY